MRAGGGIFLIIFGNFCSTFLLLLDSFNMDAKYSGTDICYRLNAKGLRLLEDVRAKGNRGSGGWAGGRPAWWGPEFNGKRGLWQVVLQGCI